MRGFIFTLLWLGTAAHGAGLKATLTQRTIIQGKSVQLTIQCDDYELATVDPERTPTGMEFAFRGREVRRASDNGVELVSTIFTYLVTLKKPGRHVVPAFMAKLPNGYILRSDPLTVVVLDRDGTAITNPQQRGFIKVQIGSPKIYLGEAFPITMELYVEGFLPGDLPVPQLSTPGFRFTRKRPEFFHTVRLENGRRYDVFVFKTGAVSTKPGKRNIVFEVDVSVRDSNNQFGDRKKLHITSDPQPMEVLPLPTEDRPANFSGVVGSGLHFKAETSQADVKTGDPLDLSIEISGRAALDQATMPGPDQWEGFKTYPATSEIKFLDSRHLHAFKSFNRILVPLQPDIAAVPGIEFVYFDTGIEQYVTRKSGPFPLRVTGPAIQTGPGDPPTLPNTQLDPDSNTGKMKTIRRAPGVLAKAPIPLLTRPWFLAAQSAPLLAWLILMGWRRRQTYLENHPEVARRLRVKKLTRNTIRSLHQTETQSDPEAFHAAVQLILREHLGMAMDRPAEGIGREILEDKALPLTGENRAALERLHESNQLARYAHTNESVNAQAAPQATLKDLDRVIVALR